MNANPNTSLGYSWTEICCRMVLIGPANRLGDVVPVLLLSLAPILVAQTKSKITVMWKYLFTDQMQKNKQTEEALKAIEVEDKK